MWPKPTKFGGHWAILVERNPNVARIDLDLVEIRRIRPSTAHCLSKSETSQPKLVEDSLSLVDLFGSAPSARVRRQTWGVALLCTTTEALPIKGG